MCDILQLLWFSVAITNALSALFYMHTVYIYVYLYVLRCIRNYDSRKYLWIDGMKINYKLQKSFHNKHFQSVVLATILTTADVWHACVQTQRDLLKKENSKTKIAHLWRIHKISFKSIFNIIFM